LRFRSEEKIWRGKRVILQGIFEILSVFWLVNRGEFVVDAWWVVVFWMVIFRRPKSFTFSKFIF
jgi:hypothetical protein